MKRRALSLILAVIMMLSLMPVQTFANTGTENTKTVIYVSKHAITTILTELIGINNIFDNVDGGVDARFRILDNDGSVAAQTAIFKAGEISRDIYEFYFDKQLEEGEYDIQFAYGDMNAPETMELDYCVKVVDAPVITDARIQLALGDRASRATIEIEGYKGNPDLYKFALISEDGDIVNCTAKHMYNTSKGFGIDGRTIIDANYELSPEVTLQENTFYTLAIESISGELYMQSLDSIEAREIPAEKSYLEVLDAKIYEGDYGHVEIKIKGAKADVNYKVTALTSVPGSNIYGKIYEQYVKPTMSGDEGSLSLYLTKNDLPLPMSVYAETGVDIFIEDENGDSVSCAVEEPRLFWNPNRPYAGIDQIRLEKGNSSLSYSFYMTSLRLFWDLLEQEPAPVFTLKDGDKELASWTPNRRSFLNGVDPYVVFYGGLTTTEVLIGGRYYDIYCGEELIVSTRLVASTNSGSRNTGGSSGKFVIRGNAISAPSIEGDKFFFCLDKLSMSLFLDNTGESAFAQLYDMTDGREVSNSPIVDKGEYNEDVTGYAFTFEIPKPSDLIDDHKYDVRFISDGKTVSLADYYGYNEGFTYDNEISNGLGYYYVDEQMFSGTNEIEFNVYATNIKNLSEDQLINFLPAIQSFKTGAIMQYESLEGKENGYEYIITAKLDETLIAGMYKVGNSKRTVFPKGTSGIRYFDCYYDDANNIEKAVMNECVNLDSTAKYTGVLYKESGQEYAGNTKFDKAANVTLEYVDENTLTVSNLPKISEDKTYLLEVYENGIFIGSSECGIYGFEGKYDTSQYGPIIVLQEKSGSEILYHTLNDTIDILAYMSEYSFVRISEDSTFADTEYVPIREKNNFTLSDGLGEKTIYIQFKKTDGTETKLYTKKCKLVTEVPEPEVLEAKVLVDGEEVSTIPLDQNEFDLSVTANSQMISVFVEFVDGNGNTYRNAYPLEYAGKGTAEETYKYKIKIEKDNDEYERIWDGDYSSVKFTLIDIETELEKDSISKDLTFEQSSLSDWESWNYDNSTNTLTVNSTEIATDRDSESDVPWEYRADEIETVVIEGRPKTIGALSFANCTSLTSITLPKSVETVSAGAFKNCTSLTTVSASINTKFDPTAFEGCGDVTIEITHDLPIEIAKPIKAELAQKTIDETHAYTASLSWDPAAENFVAGTAYKANVVLTAKDGYKLTSGIIPKIAGAESIKNIVVSADGSEISFTAVFPETAPKPPAEDPVAVALLAKTDDTINVVKVSGQEYAKSDTTVTTTTGLVWGEEVEFTELSPNTEYRIWTRVKETLTTGASIAVYKDITTNKSSIEAKATIAATQEAAFTGSTAAAVYTVSGLTEGTDFEVVYATSGSGVLKDGMPYGAGIYKVTINGIGDYEGTTTAAMTIKPYEVTITPAAGQSKVYGDDDPSAFAYSDLGLNANLKAAFDEVAADADTILKREAGENAGTYDLMLSTGTWGNNFALKLTSGTDAFEITPAKYALAASFDDEQTTVKGLEGFTEPIFTGVKGDTVTGSLMYGTASGTYDKTKDAVISDVLSGAAIDMPQTIYYQFKHSNNNYSDATTVGSFTVTVKDIEFKIGGATGDTATTTNAVTITSANQVYGKTWADIVKINSGVKAYVAGAEVPGTFTLKDSAVKPNTGDQAFTVTFTGGAYQDVTAITGTLNIAKKDVTVGPKNISIYKGAAIPAFELAYTGLISGETIVPSVTPTFAAFEAGTTPVSISSPVGKYTITWTNYDETDFTGAENYAVTKVSTGALTISNKPASKPSGGGGAAATEPEEVVTPTQGAIENVTYNDVAKKHWFYDAVMFVSERGIMNGVGGNSFAPNVTANRAMIAKMVHEMEGAPAHSFDGSFTDVADGVWYTNGILWSAENGVVTGYPDGSYGPNVVITREQLAAILYRYAEFKGYDVTVSADLGTFHDGDETSSWAKDAMEWAVGAKVVSGKGGGMLDPQGDATRAEIAQMFKNFCENVIE